MTPLVPTPWLAWLVALWLADPTPGDLARLPPAAPWEARQFGYQHLDWLRQQRDLHPDRRGWWAWRAREAAWCCECNSELHWARWALESGAGDPVPYLRDLKKLLGPVAWCEGAVPPVAPAWRFWER